jgi:hypothetical protein
VNTPADPPEESRPPHIPADAVETTSDAELGNIETMPSPVRELQLPFGALGACYDTDSVIEQPHPRQMHTAQPASTYAASIIDPTVLPWQVDMSMGCLHKPHDDRFGDYALSSLDLRP